MSQKDKLLNRLKSKPRDFTFDDMEALLLSLGFVKRKAGKTGGSRVRYEINGIPVLLHKPHRSNTLQPYQIRDILYIFEKAGII